MTLAGGALLWTLVPGSKREWEQSTECYTPLPGEDRPQALHIPCQDHRQQQKPAPAPSHPSQAHCRACSVPGTGTFSASFPGLGFCPHSKTLEKAPGEAVVVPKLQRGHLHHCPPHSGCSSLVLQVPTSAASPAGTPSCPCRRCCRLLLLCRQLSFPRDMPALGVQEPKKSERCQHSKWVRRT